MPVDDYMRSLTEEPSTEDMGRLVRYWARIEMVLDAQVHVQGGLSYEQARRQHSRGSPDKRWAELFPNRCDFYSDDGKLFRQVKFLSEMRNLVCHAESRSIELHPVGFAASNVVRGKPYRKWRMNEMDRRSRGHSDYAAAIYTLPGETQVQDPAMLSCGGVPLTCFAYYVKAAETLLAKLYCRLIELKEDRLNE